MPAGFGNLRLYSFAKNCNGNSHCLKDDIAVHKMCCLFSAKEVVIVAHGIEYYKP